MSQSNESVESPIPYDKENDSATLGSKRVRTRCGDCDGCKKSDGGCCKHCKDKKKYGGPGKLKKACLRRVCNNMSNTISQKAAHEEALTCSLKIPKITKSVSQATVMATGKALPQITVEQYYQGLAAGRLNKPTTAMITDDPIPPQFLHLFNSHKENSNCAKATLFLKHQGRRIESVLGDGNCLFQALSFLLCGTKECIQKLEKK